MFHKKKNKSTLDYLQYFKLPRLQYLTQFLMEEMEGNLLVVSIGSLNNLYCFDMDSTEREEMGENQDQTNVKANQTLITDF